MGLNHVYRGGGVVENGDYPVGVSGEANDCQVESHDYLVEILVDNTEILVDKILVPKIWVLRLNHLRSLYNRMLSTLHRVPNI